MKELSRRNFLKFTLATSALAGSSSAFGFDTDFIKIPNYTHLFYDENSFTSKQFIRKIANNNSKLYSLNKDVSEIYTKLLREISADSMLCGLTSYESFFVVSQITKSINMKPLYLNIYAIDEKLEQENTLKFIRNNVKKDFFMNDMALNLTNFIFDEKEISKKFADIKNSNKTTLYSWVIASNKRSEI